MPEPDVDEALLVNALKSAGIDAEMVVWNAPHRPWNEYAACVIRSTWDYFHRLPEFKAWIAEASRQTNLQNSAEILLANLHKRYLEDLQAKGIPIVRTVFFDKGQAADLRAAFDEWGASEVVVKPAVSGGSYMTERFTINRLKEGQEFLNQILEDRDAMVQPFLPSVQEGGEVNVICIAGEISHTIIKNPRFIGEAEQVSQRGEQPTPEQRMLAEKVLATIDGDWLYARVDLMRDDDGSWVLSELELTEPSLFLLQHPPALDRLVKAISSLAMART